MRIGKYIIHPKKNSSLIIPILVLFVIILYITQAQDLFYDLSMTLVRIVLFLIIIFDIIVIKEELIIKKVDNKFISNEKNFWEKIKNLNASEKKIFNFIILMISYLYFIDKLGYIVTTFIYLISIMFLLGIRGYKKLLILPIIMIILLYFLFIKYLLIPLPIGIFGI